VYLGELDDGLQQAGMESVRQDKAKMSRLRGRTSCAGEGKGLGAILLVAAFLTFHRFRTTFH
jgi:hypothetical protein